MKIAFLIAGLPPECIGGAEVQAARVSAYLAKNHDVLVLTRSRAIPQELLGSERAIVVRRPHTGVPLLRFAWDTLSTLATIGARRAELDVIISYQTVIDGVIASLARILFKIPVLHSVRSEKEYQLNGSLKSRVFSPFVFRNVDRLALQSPSVAEDLSKELRAANRHRLLELLGPKICILPNGIDVGPVEFSAGDYVVYVGRLVKPKGVTHLLEAMRQCPEERLLVVGDGPEMPRLREQARDMTNVEFIGRVTPDRVPGFIAGAKCLVLPSLRDEGLPNVIMQAMALGKPVVASRGAGIPDLVDDGKTGYLTEVGDPISLAISIRILCADENLRRRMGEKGARAIRRYAWPAVMDQFEKELDAFDPTKEGSGAESRR